MVNNEKQRDRLKGSIDILKNDGKILKDMSSDNADYQNSGSGYCKCNECVKRLKGSDNMRYTNLCKCGHYMTFHSMNAFS